MKALIVAATRATPHIADVVLPPVGPGEIRVRIRAAGICHSDLSMLDGTLAPSFPLVLGHEATGVVVEVGPAPVGRHEADPTLAAADSDTVSHRRGRPGAGESELAATGPEGGGEDPDVVGSRRRGLAVGDHVVLNWAPPCRECWHCRTGEPWLCAANTGPSVARGHLADGTPTHVTLGLGALAEEVVVPAHAAVRVPADLPSEAAALLGCAVLTATGAVTRTAGVTRGDSVVVIGLGGVGLAALTAARAAGADPVIGVDLGESKRDLALAAGATHFLPSTTGTPRAVRALTEGRGADHAVECVGRSATISTAWRSTRRGGQVTVVGMGAADDLVSLSALDIFHSARTLRSSVYGSSDPDRDLPALAAAVRAGSLDLTPLVTDRIALEDAPTAFARLARGDGARTIVHFG